MYICQEDEKSFACRKWTNISLRVGRARLFGCVSNGPEICFGFKYVFAMAYMRSPKVICNLTNYPDRMNKACHIVSKRKHVGFALEVVRFLTINLV